MEKVDEQRVYLSLQDFYKIPFEPYGIPNIVIHLFAFLHRESFSYISSVKV